MIEVPTPPYFTDDLSEKTVQVLPLVDDTETDYRSGWCTYTYAISGCPELEVFCGGVNDKTPKAGAIWRQGNILHFGFQPSPSQFNGVGQAMLVNSIAYIARFSEDRPIIYTPSVFVDGERFFGRDVIRRVLEKDDDDSINRLKYYTSEQTFGELREMDREQARTWAKKHLPFLKPVFRGKLEVDENALLFGIAPASMEFLEAAIEIVGDKPLARTLLDQYAPDGPAQRDDPDRWKEWLQQNRDYLFFSDSGGYRWYVDPLAKKRGVPTSTLRGTSRASTKK